MPPPGQGLPPAAEAGLHEKVAALRLPPCYPDAPGAVEAIETHMSWVFLAGALAWKLKKPVRYEQLDFRSLAARHFCCLEELRLNRRLAPSVYLDVAPLARQAAGHAIGPGPGGFEGEPERCGIGHDVQGAGWMGERGAAT